MHPTNSNKTPFILKHGQRRHIMDFRGYLPSSGVDPFATWSRLNAGFFDAQLTLQWVHGILTWFVTKSLENQEICHGCMKQVVWINILCSNKLETSIGCACESGYATLLVFLALHTFSQTAQQMYRFNM